MLQRLHDASPNEVGITSSLARLGLNIEQNTKQAQTLAQQAYERAPEDPNCAITYAFALYVQGRTTEGWEILQKLPPETLRDPHNAVYAAILLLDLNQTDKAKEYIAIAKKGPIYGEEKRLLEDEVNKAAGIPSSAVASREGGSQTPTPTPAPSTPEPEESASPDEN